MQHPNLPERANPAGRGRQAAAILAEMFQRAGWHVQRQSKNRERGPRADFIARRGDAAYRVEVKVAPEGRGDRLVPLWAQAYLQAARAAGAECPALAIVAAPSVAPRVAEQVLAFAAEYAPEAAAGVIDFGGLRRFRGAHLEGLESDPDAGKRVPLPHARHAESADLFSDLNQWMLKVLLAPEVPDQLLAAPRGRYRNASQLAQAAKVSAMSAFRLVQQLQRHGYLDESSGHLKLVRREDLFFRWRASAARRVKEVPMRFLLRSDSRVELRRILKHGPGCLALFAAADALGLGFVRGIPPHVYVPRLDPASLAAWKGIVPASRGEAPDLFLRQPQAPQSVFRGVVRANDMPVSDIVQVWLDVSSHPSRGEEQGELIRRRVLGQVLPGERDDG